MVTQVTHLGCFCPYLFCQPFGDPRGKSMFTMFFGLPGRLDFQLCTKGLSIGKCHLVTFEDRLGKEERGMRRPAVSRR